jgi:hypothetical protein
MQRRRPMKHFALEPICRFASATRTDALAAMGSLMQHRSKAAMRFATPLFQDPALPDRPSRSNEVNGRSMCRVARRASGGSGRSIRTDRRRDQTKSETREIANVDGLSKHISTTVTHVSVSEADLAGGTTH